MLDCGGRHWALFAAALRLWLLLTLWTQVKELPAFSAGLACGGGSCSKGKSGEGSFGRKTFGDDFCTVCFTLPLKPGDEI